MSIGRRGRGEGTLEGGGALSVIPRCAIAHLRACEARTRNVMVRTEWRYTANLPLKRGGRFARQSKAGGDPLSPHGASPVAAPSRPSPFQGEGEGGPVARMKASLCSPDERSDIRGRRAASSRMSLRSSGLRSYFASPAANSTNERPAVLYILSNANCAPAGSSGAFVSTSSDHCGPADVGGSLKSTSAS